ncbi:U8-agatoxin-Ao1a-like [Limulus polyphemus]|uniref:U8-agatoxin-Ao1a-like n=1 Tax=Limulus polyphemus TaxID=6850 RepID=A0ABM1RWT5_LIMPO|nr:U8-agatoxin-Ao1a-like [Limulus polyphemus]
MIRVPSSFCCIGIITMFIRPVTVTVLLIVVMVVMVTAYSISDDDYERNLARFLYYTRKRSCVRRGGSCDERPDDCCFQSSCRCNLWGTNCRCMRRGLFQG